MNELRLTHQRAGILACPAIGLKVAATGARYGRRTSGPVRPVTLSESRINLKAIPFPDARPSLGKQQ